MRAAQELETCPRDVHVAIASIEGDLHYLVLQIGVPLLNLIAVLLVGVHRRILNLLGREGRVGEDRLCR